MSYICQECVADTGLRKYVESQGEKRECSFCRREEAVTAEAEKVVAYAREQILRHYEDPANSVMHDSSEGGYQLPTMDSWELLEELGLGLAHQSFFELLEEELENEGGIWIRQDPYASPYHKQLTYDWENFSQVVKHRARFTFFRSDEKHMRDGDTAVEQPHEILDHIGDVVEITRTFMVLKPEDRIYRGRVHAPGASFSSLAELGPPPCGLARQSRMSPAGITMFYGARQADTAVAELNPGGGEMVTVGVFRPRRELVLIDFSRAAWERSIFAYESEVEPEAAAFLNRFAMEIAKPVDRDDRVHIEYVPTQIVTEYFRFLFPKERSPLHGVAYRSSLKRGGVNVVLFVGRENCSEFLELESCERISGPAMG